MGEGKDGSKPHQCPEETWEDSKLKIPENGKNNNKNVCEFFYDSRSGNDWDKENDGNVLEPPQDRDTSDDHVANGVSSEKDDPVLYMDKNDKACDLPEIVVRYNEKTYNVVKDICVDEGVHVLEKCSVKCSSNSNSNQCGSEDLKKADKTNANHLETKFSEDSKSKVDDSEICNDHKTVQDLEESSRDDFADRLEEQAPCQLQAKHTVK